MEDHTLKVCWYLRSSLYFQGRLTLSSHFAFLFIHHHCIPTRPALALTASCTSFYVKCKPITKKVIIIFCPAHLGNSSFCSPLISRTANANTRSGPQGTSFWNTKAQPRRAKPHRHRQRNPQQECQLCSFLFGAEMQAKHHKHSPPYKVNVFLQTSVSQLFSLFSEAAY